MRRRTLCSTFAIIISTLILQMPSITHAQSPAISSGLTWLNSTQSADGSWDSATATTDSVQATSAAMESLAVLNSIASPNYVNATTWLTTQTFDTTRYLSDRLKILTTSSADKDLILSYVDGLSKAWGGYDGITVNNLDTALALQALKAANYSDTTVLYQAVNFLTTNQNPDGGWGFRTANGALSADASNTYVTSIVLRMLSAYNSVFINQNSINQASAFLLAHQNTDGGFGSSLSNVYQTALSVMSLIESGQGSTQTILNGINYLASAQAADGSWNDDPYSTALALQALAEARPNLAVATKNITFSNTMPQAGDTVTITANVRNIGYDNASNVFVRFYLGDPNAGGVQIGTDQVIQLIARSSSSTASVTTVFTGTGSKTIFVVVDPDNLISEQGKRT